jgi:hypothetical protein
MNAGVAPHLRALSPEPFRHFDPPALQTTKYANSPYYSGFLRQNPVSQVWNPVTVQGRVLVKESLEKGYLV